MSMFKKKLFGMIILAITLFIPASTIAQNKNTVDKPGTVYLTFDADMTAKMKRDLDEGKVVSWYSQNLVNYLESEKISATIFVTGMFAEIYPDLIKKMAKYPNIEVANHTYDHSGFENPCYKLKIIKTDKEKKQEINKTQEILTTLVGYTPKFFRYPGLCHNKHDDKLVQKLGLTISDAGLVSGDAFNKKSKMIVKTVLNNIRDGSTIIMHLGGPNAPSTYTAVKEIVNKLRGKNYILKTL